LKDTFSRPLKTKSAGKIQNKKPSINSDVVRRNTKSFVQ